MFMITCSLTTLDNNKSDTSPLDEQKNIFAYLIDVFIGHTIRNKTRLATTIIVKKDSLNVF